MVISINNHKFAIDVNCLDRNSFSREYDLSPRASLSQWNEFVNILCALFSMIEFRAFTCFPSLTKFPSFPLIPKCYHLQRSTARVHGARQHTILLFEELIFKREKRVCDCAHWHFYVDYNLILSSRDLTKRNIQLFWNPTGNNQIITIFECEQRRMCVLTVNIRKMFLPRTHMNQIMPTHSLTRNESMKKNSRRKEERWNRNK